MSHFIQDNQCVIHTKDGKYLLFLKGGDNNVISYHNRRLSSWFLQYVFGNVEQYMAFLEGAMRGDINGGSWQFASLKNKPFEGYTGYENAVFERFERAFRKALNIHWSVKDITVENVYKFENDVVDLLRNNGFSLKNQDGEMQFYGYVVSAYTKSEEAKQEAVEKLNRQMEKYVGIENGSYRSFCKKWSNVALADALHSSDFCRVRGKMRRYDRNDAIEFFTVEKVYEITNENFALLMNFENIEDFIGSYRFDSVLKNYPEQVKHILDLNEKDLLKRLASYMDKLDKKENYRYDTLVENYGKLNKFVVDYDRYLEEKNAYEAKRIKEAPENFINTWNGLVDDCWYDTTDSRFPKSLARLRELVSLGVKLDEVKPKCNSLWSLPSKHQHQRKKNQPAIKKGAKEIMSLYLPLLDESTIKHFCQHFGFQRPVVETKLEPVNNPLPSNTAKLMGSLFD